MLDYIIYTLFGLVSGFCLGTTSFNPVGLILLVLSALNIGDYKSNLGALMVLNVFPIAIGSFFEFYKSGIINWPLALILCVTVTLGSYLGSKIITNKKYAISNKAIEYFTGYVSILIGIAFLIGARYEKN
jgi:uncharacterized membrane protein YfcA